MQYECNVCVKYIGLGLPCGEGFFLCVRNMFCSKDFMQFSKQTGYDFMHFLDERCYDFMQFFIKIYYDFM